MKRLVREGKTIIFITHKLKEIMRACDTVTVIRRGKMIDSLPVSETDENRLAALMVGRDVSFSVEKAPSQAEEPVLEVEGLVAKDNRGIEAVRGLDLTVRAGKSSESPAWTATDSRSWWEAITGLRRVDAGDDPTERKRCDEPKNEGDSPRRGGNIPEDRQKRGLVLDFSIGENLALITYNQSPFARGIGLRYPEIFAHAKRLIEQFDVRTPDERTAARALLVGNQRKRSSPGKWNGTRIC